jgi:hypothetical protein
VIFRESRSFCARMSEFVGSSRVDFFLVSIFHLCCFLVLCMVSAMEMDD